MPFGVRQPGAGVNGIAELLVREFLPGDVHDLEPVQLLGVRPLAEIDHQLVVQDLRLLVIGEGVEILFADGEVVVEVLANGYGPLLAVEDLEVPVFFLHPVHDVEGEAVADGVDDFFALPAGIDEFALVFGAHVQAAAVSHNTLFLGVLVAGEEVADGDFVKFYGHFFRRIMILLYGHVCFPFTVYATSVRPL